MVEIFIVIGVVVLIISLAMVTKFRDSVISSDLYKRGFAVHMNLFSKIHNRAVLNKKKELFSTMKTTMENIQGDILEIGSGTGANFLFFPKGSIVTALDPNPHMEKYLKSNASQFPNVTIKKVITGFAEDLSAIEDNSFAVVVCTLTLCSVQDVATVLREAKRVLKPGGCFFYLEHVSDDEGKWRRSFQIHLDRFWKYVSDGCSCARDIPISLDNAGFSTVFYEKFCADQLTIFAWLMRPHISGYAVK
ncbi:methyltransferase-like protein 7B [Exaiptasia diaphana]|uniref:Methyltransferase type 11 domain-containing protein n=1 Tax=Exaiptasia diaphana TaxID=2652724 RepID=A0A913YPR5_EXADI|nr:methyltransferase-like protein 7B [Exaiptasia diaphana]XP_020906434.1 methyltransferase-like protein 7B [Exaiptasia diaphana]XP_028516497.1 methyltransferase-like protein 7B [Exaiptasia diaphana]KXJ10863.1 Methyltransferase-like protein 7B [Exaiptasia diaphana]